MIQWNPILPNRISKKIRPVHSRGIKGEVISCNALGMLALRHRQFEVTNHGMKIDSIDENLNPGVILSIIRGTVRQCDGQYIHWG